MRWESLQRRNQQGGQHLGMREGGREAGEEAGGKGEPDLALAEGKGLKP